MHPSTTIPESSKPSKLQERLHAELGSCCNGNEAALNWLDQVRVIAMEWDHVIDNDPIDRGAFDVAMVTALVKWQLDPFFQANKASLLPVVLNAITAWRHANQSGYKIKAFDVYSEIGTAIALITGGVDFALSISPSLRDLCVKVMLEDDERDGGKL